MGFLGVVVACPEHKDKFDISDLNGNCHIKAFAKSVTPIISAQFGSVIDDMQLSLLQDRHSTTVHLKTFEGSCAFDLFALVIFDLHDAVCFARTSSKRISPSALIATKSTAKPRIGRKKQKYPLRKK